MPDNFEGLAGLVGIGLLGVIGYSLISAQNIYQYPNLTAPSAGTGAAAGTLDANGVKLLHKITGNKVPMGTGADHRNGQRYNVNHKFKNYMMIGYFKTGSGQKQIEMKTDGPNHGSCTSLPKCCWVEADLDCATGQTRFTSEWPHPKNHGDAPCPSCKALGSIANKWIGYSVIAYQSGAYRTYEQWADLAGLDAAGKPSNKWQLGGKITDTGQVTNPELAKRALFLTGAGMEAEIRMHQATGGDTAMKFCTVYEIVPPTSATTTTATTTAPPAVKKAAAFAESLVGMLQAPIMRRYN